MAPFNAQLIRKRTVVVSDKKETTYGTGVLDANFTAGHVLRFQAESFAQFPDKSFFTDEALAKGFPWPSVRAEIQRKSAFSISGLAVYDYIAGWLGAFCFGKVTTTGGGSPYTHKFTADLSTLISPVTSLLIQDTADIKYKLIDLAINSLKFSGSGVGPVTCDFDLVGSGQYADSVLAPPALVNPTFLLNNDADILLGPPGAPVSIKERIKSWGVSITANQEPVWHPGSGLFAGYTRRGDMQFDVQMQVDAKDVDDIRTLIIGDTDRELQININSGAAAQLKFRFPHVKLKGTPNADGSYVAWNLDFDILASNYPTDEPIEMTVLDAQATWLTAG